MAVFRVDKTKDYTVMSNHHLRNTALSMKAKGLLSLMLSLPDNWDYTLFGLSTISTDGLSSIRAAVAELENAGYLRRRRIRNDKGQLTETEYTILEQPAPPDSTTGQPICEKPILDNPMLDFPTLEKPTLGKPILENRTQLNTNISNTKKSNTYSANINPSITDPSIMPDAPKQLSARHVARPDMMDEMESYREIIRGNIEYESLLYSNNAEQIDELVQLMVDAVCSRKEFIRIDSADYPAEVVKNRLLKLRFPHIEYVLDALSRNTTKIHNIRSYLLTTLYNSLSTLDSYYQAEVSHDLYGSR